MRAWLSKHSAALLAAIGINFPAIWHGIKWLWDWAGRLDVVASHARDLQGVGGMMSFFISPPPWTVFVTGLLGVLIILWDVRHPNTLRNLTAAKNRMALYLGLAIACFVAGTGFSFAAYWQYTHPLPPAPAETELYKAARDDFRHSGGLSEQAEVINHPNTGVPPITVKIWIHSDLVALAKFLVFYVPAAFDMPISPPLGGIYNLPARQTFDAVKQMADRFPEVIKRADSSGSAGIGDVGLDNMRYSTEAPFTGAIYIYHEGDLTDAERVELRALYASKGAHSYFRGWRYLKEGRSAVTR